ncbi:MAG: OmpA family protein [Rickettsiales bacterium]|nr:OmpA family protein [Rickettsiales bacterium]
MSFFKKIITLLIVITFTVSCNEKTDLQKLSELEFQLKSDQTYNSYLALEYLLFARNLSSIKDEKMAKYFAQKGLKVASGKRVYPESPLKWKADPLQIEGMVLMQKRLEEILKYPNAKYYLPIQVAHLTYLYDCWIIRESKPVFKGSDIASCRTTFSKLIDEIEVYIENLGKDKNREATIIAPIFHRYNIDFDFNSYQINAGAVKKIIEVLSRIYKLNGDYRILLVGNADRSGKKLYNQSLAYKRANNVRRYLIKNGVDKSLIELRSFGESFPDLITEDNMKSQYNRNVQIYIIEHYNDLKPLPLPLIQNEVYKNEINAARKKRGI